MVAEHIINTRKKVSNCADRIGKLTSGNDELTDMIKLMQVFEFMNTENDFVNFGIKMFDENETNIGTLATDEGLNAIFELKNGSLTPASTESFKYYDINFTVQGSYAGVSLYISDLEDDSELNFKIENFSMEPVENGNYVKATFTTKDIAIEGISSSTVTTTTSDSTNGTSGSSSNTNSTGNTTSGNTAGTTNNTTTNTTNSGAAVQ